MFIRTLHVEYPCIRRVFDVILRREPVFDVMFSCFSDAMQGSVFIKDTLVLLNDTVILLNDTISSFQAE